MHQARRSVLLSVLAALLVLSGCRTYGGYGTKAKNYEAMQDAVQSFEEELSRAQAELETLEEAATSDTLQTDTLQGLARQFREHIDRHESLLETQRKRVDRLDADAAYRTLQRMYGATVKEQRIMEQKYQHVIQTVRTTVHGEEPETAASESRRRYTIRPVNFPDSEADAELTMERALQGR